MWSKLAALSVATAIGACATPQTSAPGIARGDLAMEQEEQRLFTLELRESEFRRVYDIAERLRAANADLCPDKEMSLGLRVENINDYPREFRAAAAELWDLDQTPAVNWVGPGSPAERAGVQRHDRLISINGKAASVPATRNSRAVFRSLRAAAREGAVTLELMRGETPVTVHIAPQQRCGYDFVMTDGAEVNAYADGDTMYITRGMMRFVRSDEEIALVLAHELAHNAMDHIDAQQQNALLGTIAGALVDGLFAAGGVNTGGAFTDAGGQSGRAMFSREFETEADYVGMYFMHRAGYSTEGVEHFWRRMAADHPSGIRVAGTHPTTAARFLTIASARDEIARKAANGEELRPNMRADED